MKPWDEMTDAEQDEANETAWAVCADLLRRAQAEQPGRDLAECRRLVGAQMRADYAEGVRLIQRGERSRATRMDRRSAEWARERNAHLALQMGVLPDVEP